MGCAFSAGDDDSVRNDGRLQSTADGSSRGKQQKQKCHALLPGLEYRSLTVGTRHGERRGVLVSAGLRGLTDWRSSPPSLAMSACQSNRCMCPCDRTVAVDRQGGHNIEADA